MKQKYTITVAGMEMSVLSDGSAESVETVVASLDRKMREIFLHSPRCSKNEAALLCALDYCASHLAEEEHLAELEESAVRYQSQIANLESENARLKAALDKLLAEKREGAAEDGSHPASSEASAPANHKQAVNLEAAAHNRKGKKNRVGNMFDLLTFQEEI